jgi:hypothetical protein
MFEAPTERRDAAERSVYGPPRRSLFVSELDEATMVRSTAVPIALTADVVLLAQTSVNANLLVTIPNVKVEFVVLGGAMVLVLAGLIFHTALGL